ncbi:hypothetical protein O159_02090 [Leifsonia xyli subsp. cynodontis DSM 46306]|uniref:Uncharacterized protein n=1 Tax=Leifsonia xyli subsp. cynodontis DSM 46306 TaxID=1389489 RepID=U3P3Z2_LEIXC|nr:hypothetical protein [Leifsonia xyli]AGW40451.1 hypothetical protein O159_02090 [Leifsonia xyli subsp. cynodontis DSM 46306]
MGRRDPAPLRLYASISHDLGVDPKVLVDRVTPVWQKHGFTVSTVVPYRILSDGYRDANIRGDRADGAKVGLFASNEIVSINIQTVCSTHETVLDEYRRTIEATIPTLPPSPIP